MIVKTLEQTGPAFGTLRVGTAFTLDGECYIKSTQTRAIRFGPTDAYNVPVNENQQVQLLPNTVLEFKA